MKTAVVTGASTGIGRAVSLALAQHGFEVILVARRREELEKTLQLIQSAQGVARIEIADLSSLESINTLITSISTITTQIHLIANIAGIWHGKESVYAGKDFQTFDQKVILDTFYVGTISPTLLVHGLLPIMPKGAKIINLSGTFEDGGKGWLPYYVSKRAIEDLTVGLSQELADKGIHVNCISPSDTATEEYQRFFPQFATDANDPKDIALQFVKLADEKNVETGKVFVMKKGTDIREAFHF